MSFWKTIKISEREYRDLLELCKSLGLEGKGCIQTFLRILIVAWKTGNLSFDFNVEIPLNSDGSRVEGEEELRQRVVSNSYGSRLKGGWILGP
ncbi:hypothetical protein CW710_01215 [Candidatus Bathyarchaeota archaeon]|nr:hypothetical protein [Candidatus Bathyarchaeota archaeon]RJS74640.1 MAG: hypothetical protein CW710_01215 [Candidatus Bathyarchaeota archaeon]